MGGDVGANQPATTHPVITPYHPLSQRASGDSNPALPNVERRPALDREDAMMKLCEIWEYVGQKYAEPQAKQRAGASKSFSC
jgi:hypothetical protein